MLEHYNINLKSNDNINKYYESAIKKSQNKKNEPLKECCKFNEDRRANKAIE